MSAETFIDKLEEVGLFEDKLISKLRDRVAKADRSPSAASVAKYLIKREELTEAQAKKLLVDIKNEASQSRLDLKKSSLGKSRSSRSKPSRPMPDEVEIDNLDVEVEDIIGNGSGGDDVEVIEMEVSDLSPDAAEVEVVEVDGDDDSNSRKKRRKKKKRRNDVEEIVEAVYEDGDVENVVEKSTFRKRGGPEEWESKWVLILPAVLIILALSGGLLYWVMSWESVDQRWEAAEDAYATQNYVTSMELHGAFAEGYSKDPRAAIASAKVRMAKLRIPFGARKWELTLQFFEEELPDLVNDLSQIKDPSAQSDIRMELAGMLPDNARGFVDAADKQKSVEEAKKLLDLAEKNLALVNSGSNIPKSLRELPVINKKIDGLIENAARVRRKVDREDELVAGLAKIKAMSEEDDTQGAARAYEDLLRVYPELRTEKRLLDAIRALSKKHQTLVRKFDVSMPVSNEARQVDSKSIVLATRVGKEVSGLQGVIQPILINGAVYGIDVGAGRVAWRHFVGYQTLIEPVLADSEQPMVLVSDMLFKELKALNPESGELIWRTQIDEVFFAPMLIEDQVFVSTVSGKVIQIDIVDGQSGKATQIPQPFLCEAAPFVSSGRRRLLQLGDQTNLYLLNATDMTCLEAYFLGHNRGAIEVPPLVLSQHILIAENRPNHRSTLHVLKIGEDGLLQTAQNGLQMGGHVHVPLRLYGRRAMLVTDSGEIRLFEIDTSKPGQALKQVAETKQKLYRNVPTRFIPQEGKLWVADRGITRFDIQTQKGKLARQMVSNNLDTFVGPLKVFFDHDMLMHVRRRRGSSLISVAAVDIETQAEFWRLDLASPLAGPPFVEKDSQQLVAANCQGDLFPLGPESLEAGFAGNPLLRASTAEQDLNFPYQVDLGDGDYAFVGKSSQQRMLYLEPGRRRPFDIIDMKGADYVLRGQPVGIGKHVLIASRDGMVQLIDPTNPRKPLKFLPEKKPDSQFEWQTAAPIDESNLVMADRAGTMYLLKKDARSVRQQEKVKHDQEFVRPPAVLDGYVVVVSSDGRKHRFVSFQLPELARKQEYDLPAAAAFGPYSIDKTLAIVATESGQVICLDADAKEVWKTEIIGAIMTGATTENGRVALTALDGRIFWLNAADGELITSLQMGETTMPDRTYPLIHDGKLYVGSADGTMHVTEIP